MESDFVEKPGKYHIFVDFMESSSNASVFLI